ncbi:MAG: ATP synthase F0 subunit B [Thermodesulfobacteriota bacterium]
MINLNLTLIIQLVVVLILMVILSQVAFKPFLRLMYARREWMNDMEKKTKELKQRLEEMMEKYQEAMAGAQAQGTAIREEIRQESLQKEMEILQQARKEANILLQEMKAKIAQETEIAKGELQERAKELSRTIVEKVLGRSLS